MLYDVLILAVVTALIMSALLLGIVLWTVALKMLHPNWSWRRCAKYTTLIS